MLTKLRDVKAAREAMLALLPTGGTMAGIAIGLVSLIQYLPVGNASTLADDILLVASLGFLLMCYAIFFAMRIDNAERLERALRWIDALFIISLSLMVFSGFVITYEIL